MTPQLVPYRTLDHSQVDTLRQLEVTPEQRLACGDIASTLYTLGSSPPDAVAGWALLVDRQPRAFLLLMRAPCLPSWAEPTSAMVLGLQVDHRYQGQGLGRHCLRALPRQARGLWPEIDQLTLSVDPGNTTALKLYRALGWAEAGRGHRAKVGYERRYRLNL